MRTTILAIGLWAIAATAYGQSDFPFFLDGSVRPGDAGWARDGQQGQVIDLGDGNKAIRQIDSGAGYDEYYLTIFDTSNTLATRFRVDAYSLDPADQRTQILALTPGGNSGGDLGPGIGLSIFHKDDGDHWILDRFTAGHIEILDIGPVILGEWNIALMYTDSTSNVIRFEWNYDELYHDLVTGDYGGAEGYPEFGASNYWTDNNSSSTVAFDWVGYGPGYIAVVPEPSTLVLALGGAVGALWPGRRRLAKKRR